MGGEPLAVGERTIASCRPCQTDTGTVISSSAKPHGRVNARSSSCQPQVPLETPSQRGCLVLGELAGQRGAVDVGDETPSISATVSAVTAASSPANGSRNRLSASAPSSGRTELLVVLLPIPASQSRPPRRQGATPARVAHVRPVGKQRGAGERVRAAAGPADHVKPLEAERAGELDDVFRGVGDRSARLRVEPA